MGTVKVIRSSGPWIWDVFPIYVFCHLFYQYFVVSALQVFHLLLFLFDTVVSGFVQMFFSDFSLLVCRNAAGFCMLIFVTCSFAELY